MTITTTTTSSEKNRMDSRTVLIPTDFSDVSVKMLDFTMKHILRQGDAVIVYHAIPDTGASLPDITDVDMFASSTGVTDYEQEQEAKLHSKLIAEAKKCGQEWSECIQSVHESISTSVVVDLAGTEGPGPMIIKAIEKYQPNMVVVGTHGKSSLRTLIMGSVSSYVLAHCKDIPVLTISNHH